VTAISQGRGGWHFKISKKKPQTLHISRLKSMTCSCSSSSRHSSYSSAWSSNESTCLLKRNKATLSDHRENERQLAILKKLLTPEQQSQLVMNRKRPADIATVSLEKSKEKEAKKQKSTCSEIIDLT